MDTPQRAGEGAKDVVVLNTDGVLWYVRLAPANEPKSYLSGVGKGFASRTAAEKYAVHLATLRLCEVV